MKTIISALLLTGTLGAYSGVHAQNSTLRVACNGNDVGAEVTIDGQFKGECPLEARVSAGTVKLRLVKKVDSLRERVFEQDIRLGDGVVKQVNAALSAPRLIAEGQGGESKPPAAESTETGIRAQTDTAAPQGLTPPRPPIPFEISEDLWKIIEASEAYRNLPQPRAIKVVFQGKQETEYTGAKIKSLPNPGAKTISTTRVITPVGDKCTMILTNSVTDGKPDGASGSYYCGSIWLGSTSGGKPGMIISSIDELKGSLFPMRVGARQTARYQMAYLADRQYDSTHAADCAVVGRLAAQELDPRLTGAAWKVRCKSSYNASAERETDDYYLEDLAVMLGAIGAYDSSKKTHVLPSAGTQTLIEAEGDYGSRNITAYASYNWEVGGVYEVPAQVATIAAISNDGRPAAVRDEPVQREQPQPVGLSDEATLAQQLSAAAAGDASAMASLGARYETGKGVAKNFAQAAHWYQKAAAAGDSAGIAGLGSLYLNGTGLPKDTEQARILFSKAAEAGNGRGMNGIGVLYDSGVGGLPEDPAQAVVWFEKAAAAGEPRAMANLGHLYSSGEGVAKNDSEAASWYRKAAAAGSVKGMFELGIMYVNGQGVAKSDAEAVSWYRKAALAGFAPAMTSLGYHLYAGEGVPKNEAEGIAWERKAAALGDARAIKNLKFSLADQAKRNSPQNTGTTQAAQPASSGSGFFGAMLGGLASGLLDRNAAMLNSAAASTGGASGAVMGELANANTQLARETREKIARDMGGNGAMEGVAGTAVGSALGSGSRAGAVSALSGATNNLTGSASSGSPMQHCTQTHSCAAGSGTSASGSGGGLSSTAASLAGASTVVGSCSTPMSKNFDNQLQANFNKYKNDGQCGPIVQAAEALRIKAIANCKAGDTKSADLIYQGQYLKQMVGYVKTACP